MGVIPTQLPSQQAFAQHLKEASATTAPAVAFNKVFRQYGIKVVACDFDGTLANRQLVVQKRKILDSLPETCISQDLLSLIKELQKKKEKSNCKFTITTFSDPKFDGGQPDRIAGAQLVTPFAAYGKFSIDKIYDFYPPFYDDPEDIKKLAIRISVDPDIALKRFEIYPQSKNIQLSFLCDEFKVEPSQIVLIDDDITNIKNAATFGSYAILANVRGPHGFSFQEMTGNPDTWVQRKHR